MKKRILSILLVVTMLAVMIPAFAVTSSAATTVTDWTASTITLKTPDDFKAFHDQIRTKGKGAFAGQTIKLGANIDMTGYTFNMFAADDANNYVGFAGIFDGQYHTLSGINANAANCTGFFGNPGNPAEGEPPHVQIKNLALVNTTIKGNDCGVFYGMVNAKVTFENVYNAASITGSGHNAGFIESTRWGSPDVEFINCIFDGTVQGSNYQSSGFIGGNLLNGAGKDAPVFTNCLVAGTIKNGNSIYDGGYKFLGNASKSTVATYTNCIQYNNYYQNDAGGQTYAVCPELVSVGSGFDAKTPEGWTALNEGYPVPNTLLPFFMDKVAGARTAETEALVTEHYAYQTNADRTSIRFVAAVNGAADGFTAVGHEIIAVTESGKVWTNVTDGAAPDVTTVYTSVLEDGVSKAASDCGGDYVFVSTVNGIAKDVGTVTFIVKTFSKDAEGNVTYSDMCVIKFDTASV